MMDGIRYCALRGTPGSWESYALWASVSAIRSGIKDSHLACQLLSMSMHVTYVTYRHVHVRHYQWCTMRHIIIMDCMTMCA